MKPRMKTINTAGCSKCQYCTLDESDKSNIKVNCSAHDKTYTYGKRIECEDFLRRS